VSTLQLNDVIPLFANTESDDCFCKREPSHGSVEAWRHLIRNRHANGLAESRAIVKRRGRWWLIVPRYVDWLVSADEGEQE
jgi:hypothetical protein